MVEDDVVVSVRLDEDVALKLGLFAHEAHATMNEFAVAVLAMAADGWAAARRGSRNGREGGYVGRANGRHVRSGSPCFYVGMPVAVLARALAHRRTKERVSP